ncbi:MAG: histidinol-phosphatase [Thalassospira sp.]|uniref:histidinol-phosphatase n=1 Tax=Thalassospira sp. TaxID=1912094 RepID=UPI001B06DAD1|nr:histidinol-phosphatase [Thalassospira sp.]MBO6580799.1 histidinol-phosphatase [Thalassospira sp.]MBO6801652.1 histidinol-phosphatase [Thalassospira sp.]MBO6817608.1 histidinol-phosphatase [Thalassospira sp.]MBO6887260.1 histidinol-phosphatase [Thalassospira sp.]
MENLDPFLEIAHKLADAARPVVRKYYRTPVAVDVKADDSPVTIADREVERTMRDILNAELPDHGILGEEHGRENTDAEYVWVLDPIDGTKSFISGKPSFATLIALCHKGTPVLGIIDQAITDERWVGVMGQASTMNGVEISARECEDLKSATFFTTAPELFKGDAAKAYQEVSKSCRVPMYGVDAYAYGLTALGLADTVVEIGLQAYDFCALVPVVEGAGGVMTDWSGNPLDIDSAGDVVASGDARCHQDVLATIKAAMA